MFIPEITNESLYVIYQNMKDEYKENMVYEGVGSDELRNEYMLEGMFKGLKEYKKVYQELTPDKKAQLFEEALKGDKAEDQVDEGE